MDDALFRDLLEKARRAGVGEPCWCGSALPFDGCHRDRHRQPQLTVQTVIERVEATMGRHRRACLHFDAPASCSADSGRSHTIQRAALERLADDAHVLGFVPSIPKLLKGRHLPQRLGLKVASTMTAFCAKHDHALFAPLETKPYTGVAEQAFLLSYRALCRDIFATEWKVSQLLPTMRGMDRGLVLEEQIALQLSLAFDHAGAEIALRLLHTVKGRFDAKLQSGDFSGLRFIAVEFAEMPTIASCCARVPVGDFAGRVRDGLDRAQDLVPMSFSLLPTVGSGVALFTWLGESPANDEFAASLGALKDAEVADAIVRFAFSYAENTFMSPLWWAGLPESTVDALVARMRARPAASSLLDDGVQAARWPVSRRSSGQT